MNLMLLPEVWAKASGASIKAANAAAMATPEKPRRILIIATSPVVPDYPDILCNFGAVHLTPGPAAQQWALQALVKDDVIVQSETKQEEDMVTEIAFLSA